MIPERVSKLDVIFITGPAGAWNEATRHSLARMVEALRPLTTVSEYRLHHKPQDQTGSARVISAEDLGELAHRLAEGRKDGGIVVLHRGLSRAHLETLDLPRRQQLIDGRLPWFLVSLNAFLNPGPSGSEADGGETAIEEDLLETARRRLSRGRGPILMEGETGSGKTRLAGLLHREVLRRSGRFLALNCASLDQARFDTFFRGVEAGKYTGVEESASVFVDLNGGTVFLDEFQDLGLSQQAMLLDLLDSFSNRVSGYRVGNNVTRWHSDVQVIVAVNQPVAELLSTKALRSDLFHRLYRRIRLSPLREQLQVSDRTARAFLRHKLVRLQELGFWAETPVTAESKTDDFLATFQRAFSLMRSPDTGALSPIPEAIGQAGLSIPRELATHAWPGNYRELEGLAHELMDTGQLARFGGEANVVLKLKELTMGIGGRPAVPDSGATPTAAQLLGAAYLVAAREADGGLPHMADALGLDPRTLRKYLAEWIAQTAKAPHFGREIGSLVRSEQDEFTRMATQMIRSRARGRGRHLTSP